MSRDTDFASKYRINESMQVFSRKNIPCISFEITPIKLTSTTFRDRIPTIEANTSHYIYQLLKQNNWLDSNNYLTYNPRRIDTWKLFVFAETNSTQVEMKEIFRNIITHQNVIAEFLNTIYGEHEISFEHSAEALQWHKNLYDRHIEHST